MSFLDESSQSAKKISLDGKFINDETPDLLFTPQSQSINTGLELTVFEHNNSIQHSTLNKELGSVENWSVSIDNTTATNEEPAVPVVSTVWDFFTHEPGANLARCKNCKKDLKVTKGATTGIRKHLKGVHKINILLLNKNGNYLFTF